jgi:hypothetical protein
MKRSGEEVNMARSAIILVSALVLSACGSAGVRVDQSEEYRGREAAALAPVADRRAGGALQSGRSPTEVQREIQSTLERSGTFEGVVALERRGDENEAEVIIEPTLVGRREDPTLQVRVMEKTTGKRVLEQTYSGARGDSIQSAVQQLAQDLEERYGGRTRLL